MFLSSYCILWSHFQQLVKREYCWALLWKLLYLWRILFCFLSIWRNGESFFYWFPFTRIFLLLNADKILYLGNIFQLIYKKTWYLCKRKGKHKRVSRVRRDTWSAEVLFCCPVQPPSFTQLMEDAGFPGDLEEQAKAVLVTLRQPECGWVWASEARLCLM